MSLRVSVAFDIGSGCGGGYAKKLLAVSLMGRFSLRVRIWAFPGAGVCAKDGNAYSWATILSCYRPVDSG